MVRRKGGDSGKGQVIDSNDREQAGGRGHWLDGEPPPQPEPDDDPEAPPPWVVPDDMWPEQDPYRASSSTTAPVTDVWLEVGFGAGEHLAWQAEAHTQIGLIGAEPYVAGMAKLLSRIADKDLRNIRLYTEDVRDVVAAAPDASFGRIFILFPDPWPKTRHHKRRFIQMAMLDELARVMKRGAELRFATDDMSYLEWALERFCAHSAFRWMAESPADWRIRPPDWPETRYEAKAKKAGRKCSYLRFARA